MGQLAINDISSSWSSSLVYFICRFGSSFWVLLVSHFGWHGICCCGWQWWVINALKCHVQLSPYLSLSPPSLLLLFSCIVFSFPLCVCCENDILIGSVCASYVVHFSYHLISKGLLGFAYWKLSASSWNIFPHIMPHLIFDNVTTLKPNQQANLMTRRFANGLIDNCLRQEAWGE